MQIDHASLEDRLRRISEFSDRVPRALAISLSLILLSLAVLVDWRPLGVQIAFPLYYLIPICGLAWFVGWLPGLAATIASVTLSFGGLFLAGSAPGVSFVVLLGRIVTFGLALALARASAIGRLMLDYFLLGEQLRARIIPIRIGPRLVSIPTRDPDIRDRNFELRPGDIPLLIRPGMAFGSGSHETTQMCLMLLEDHLKPGQVVFDFGSGSGILSIAAAKLGARVVYAADIAPQAEQSIQENIELNQLAHIIRFRRGSWPVFLDPPSREDRRPGHAAPASLPGSDLVKADLLLANILTPILIEALREGLTRCVEPGGELILSGIRVDQWDEIRRALDEAGLDFIERRQMKGWLAVVASLPQSETPT